jgi:hypothetical protein
MGVTVAWLGAVPSGRTVLDWAPRSVDVWGSGGVAPRILGVGAGCR